MHWTAAILVASVGLAGGENRDLEELARRVQEECESYRLRKFEHGTMTFRQWRMTAGADGAEHLENENVIRVVFNGECLRNDIRSDAVAPLPKSQVIVCGDQYISVLGPNVVATVAPVMEYGGHAGTLDHFGLVHPRWLGMGNNPLTALTKGRKYRDLQLGPTDPLVGVEEEILNGVQTWRITYEGSGETFARLSATSEPKTMRYIVRRILWIAQSQGYGLLRSEWRAVFPEEEVELANMVASSYRHDPSSDTWYPAETTRTTRRNGVLINGERIVVEEASFSPPDPQEFRKESVLLSQGQRLLDRTDGARQKQYHWDGAKLILIPTATSVSAPAEVRVLSSWRGMLLVNSAVLMLCGLFFILKRRSTRSAEIESRKSRVS